MMQTEIRQRLEGVFEPRQAAVLAEVIAIASGVAALTNEIGALTSNVSLLAEAQQRTERRLEALAEAQQRTEERLVALTAVVQQLADTLGQATARIGRLDGRMLEITYRERAGSYFGALIRRVRVVPPHTLEDSLEARLTHEEFLEVLRLDLLVSGRSRRVQVEGDVWLAIEVSVAIDEHDVVRARRRASLLRKAGYQAVPVVAGERLTADAEGAAREHPVVVMLDGYALHWEEAVADLLNLQT